MKRRGKGIQKEVIKKVLLYFPERAGGGPMVHECRKSFLPDLKKKKKPKESGERSKGEKGRKRNLETLSQ